MNFDYFLSVRYFSPREACLWFKISGKITPHKMRIACFDRVAVEHK